MGVTQYIGARYVPLFADPAQWDNTRTYEPLTIVLHEGNSFTSKQFVPVGIDIDNETFWARTGNYNAQVEQYRQEVRTYDNRITTNAENIITNSNNIAAETTAREAAINSEIENRESADNALSDSIENLDTTINAKIDNLDDVINEEIRNLDEKQLVKNAFSKYVYPTYLGDIVIPKIYESNPQCSSVCQDGEGYLYVFMPDNYTGKGTMNIYTPDGTRTRSITNMPMGHANSAVWVEQTNKIVCNCLNTYNDGVQSPTNNVIEITPVTGTYTVKQMPTRFYGMSYDHVAKKLYGIGMYTTSTEGSVYELDVNDYSYIEVQRFNHANSHEFGQATIPQDAAINDGVLFVLYTEGTCYFDKLNFDMTATQNLENSAKFRSENELWIMGETEGIEFSPNGELLGSCNFYLNAVVAGFIVSWAINGELEVIPFANYSLHGTIYLENRTSLKASNHYTIQSIELYEIMKSYGTGTLEVHNNTNFIEPSTNKASRITKNVSLHIASGSSFTAYELSVLCGAFFLRNEGTFKTTATAAAIDYSSRSTIMSVDNRGTIESASDRFLSCGYNKMPLTVGSLGDANITVNDTVLTSTSLYIGDHKTNA